jgi:hypothetical protein
LQAKKISGKYADSLARPVFVSEELTIELTIQLTIPGPCQPFLDSNLARIVTQLSVYEGRYQRVIGRAFNSNGKLSPRKFLLGTDAQKAKLANARLEQLWVEVVAEHEQTLDFRR